MPSAARHGLEAAMWRRTAARLRNRPRLESCPVSVHLAHTKRVAWHPSPGAAGPTAGTLTRLAMIATAISKSVETDHVIAQIATIRFARAAGLTLNYTGLYTYSRAGMHQKEIKTFLQLKCVSQ